MSGILGPRGQNWVALGGERCHKQWVKGDIVATLQWLDIGKKDPSACLVLFPATLKLDGGAYAIPQENAWEYADNKGNPTPHLLVAAHNATVSMGFFPDKATVFRVVDLIVEGLPELVRMPSDQPAAFDIKRAVHGIEATAKINGHIVHQEVL